MTTQDEPELQPVRAMVPRVIGLCLVAVFALASYSVARPAIESLFLAQFTRAGLPYVWIAVAIAATLTVTLYNTVSAKIPLPRLFIALCFIISALLGLILLLTETIPDVGTFLLYVWKDIYIVFLVELFWCYANNFFVQRSAKWIYGLFTIAGTVGSLLGNSSVGWLTQNTSLTSHTVLWLIPILLGLSSLALWGTDLLAGSDEHTLKQKTSPLSEGFKVLANSRYLGLLLILIVVTQTAVNLIDFQYNGFLEENYPDTDARTAVSALVYSYNDFAVLILQAFSGFIIQFLGVGKTLLGSPAIVGLSFGAVIMFPHFAIMAFAKVSSKVFDYSISRVAKELLFIPLSYEERTQGKAIVDMMGYRVAKAVASFLLIALSFAGLNAAIPGLTVVIIVLWIYIVVKIIQKYDGDI